MAAHIPSSVPEDPLHSHLIGAGLILIHQGKVRSTYSIPEYPDLLLSVASDRISIFDFVLNALVPKKGEVLTAMTIFWLTEVLHHIPNHLVASGRSIDQYLPPKLINSNALRKRALVVTKLDMLPVECIIRGYLTGSGWKEYKKDQCVWGAKLAPNLYDGSRILPHPIFTPTTKAEVGHDVPIPADDVVAKYGEWVRERSLLCYTKMSALAQNRGIIMADTKFEFGKNETLADEVGTPDSSRFWDFAEWNSCAVQRTSPPSRDKEFVRKWGEKIPLPEYLLGVKGLVGIQNLSTTNPLHLEFVDTLIVPLDIVNTTTQIYLLIFAQLTRTKLTQFQAQMMGV